MQMGVIRNKQVALRAGLALLLSGAGLVSGCSKQTSDQTIGVYSGRHYNSDQALYKEFTAQTGIKVQLLEAKDDALIERLKQEGQDSPADVLILADAARLERASQQGLFQAIDSKTLTASVPADLRDSNNRWFGLTRRLRVPMLNTDQVQPNLVTSYLSLAEPELKGKVCLRNRRSVYNQSLVAFMLDQEGAEATAAWIRGMVGNLAQPVFNSDTPMIRAVAQGSCGVALANTYYLGRLQAGDKGAADQELSRAVTVRWPNPVHVNITGAGVTRASRHPEAAKTFLEFLSSKDAQGGYAAANHEYPLNGLGDDPILNAWGPFEQAEVSAERLGARNAEAAELMAANGWQ